MILRLLNPQGIAGIAVSLALAILLVIQKAETHHSRKQSGEFEQLYRAEQSSFAETVANYRAAAATARAADLTNGQRVAAAQQTISERTSHDYQTRLADARARAERLRLDSAAAADSGARGAAPVPRLSAAPGGPAQAPGQDRLSGSDALVATEQAIQLDELIKWVKAQRGIDPNSAPPPH